MKNIKIAVITTSKDEFLKYKNLQSLDIKDKLHKISVLSDIKEKEYNKVVFIKGYDNVTDRVIKDVSEISLVKENLANYF